MNRIAVEKKVLNENQILAEQLRERYRQNGVLCVNLISSPGSGKTALLERTLERMDKSSRVAVLTGDLQTENDARRLAKFGFPVKQITTGGTCHLDARMIGKTSGGLEAGRSRSADRRKCRQPGLSLQLRSGRGCEDRSAEHHRRRGQAAEVSVDLLQVGADAADQDRPAALRAVQGRRRARECPLGASRNGDHRRLQHDRRRPGSLDGVAAARGSKVRDPNYRMWERSAIEVHSRRRIAFPTFAYWD